MRKFISYNRRITERFAKPLNLNTEFFDRVKTVATKSNRVLEIGGSDRPLLRKEDIPFYMGCDLDESKNYTGLYHQMHIGFISDSTENDFDLIFSQYLMEHVEDARQMFLDQIAKTKVGGTILHIYPMGYHPFSIGSRIAEFLNLKGTLIKILRPEEQHVTGYKTYYNLGNIYKLRKFLDSIPGINYSMKFAFSGADYFGAFFPLGLCIEALNRILDFFSLNFFASNILIEIKKFEAHRND